MNEISVEAEKAQALILDHIFLCLCVSSDSYWVLETMNCTLSSVWILLSFLKESYTLYDKHLSFFCPLRSFCDFKMLLE